MTLGRHTNDHVTSFYSRSPSGFMVEYGWGGRCVDARQLDRRGIHRRPEPVGPRAQLAAGGEARGGTRDAHEARADGVRHPVQVIEGNYRLMPGTCPWWDEAVGAAQGGVALRRRALLALGRANAPEALDRRRCCVYISSARAATASLSAELPSAIKDLMGNGLTVAQQTLTLFV